MKAKYTLTGKFLDPDGIITENTILEDVGTKVLLAYIEHFTIKKLTPKKLYKAFKPLVLPGNDYFKNAHTYGADDSFLIITRTK